MPVAPPPEGFLVNGKVLYAWTAKQKVFHDAAARNVLYGGAAGGGKSHALRWDGYMRCLSLANYRVLLLRRTYPELENTHLEAVPVELGSFGVEAATWYLKSERKIRFPNGSVMQFGHCEDEAAVGKYLSTEYDAIYFDELVTFTEKQFLMIRSRARSTKPGVKPVIRAGTNPGGPESHWVRRRFIWQDITPKEDPRYRPEDYQYVPATLDDNPHIDQAEYAANLESLPEELARAYRFGAS
jgi:phage terminase large subunit